MRTADKLRKAQDFINRELQKQSADRFYAQDWEQTPHDRATRTHRLVVFRDGEKSVFTFTEYELLENYGSKKWEKHLWSHVGKILMRIIDE